MAGGVKGNNGAGAAGRRRSYGLMLILAFGVAVMGVLAIHKLRDRRIFNLIVEEKDRQLVSLQLLIQKERQSGKDERRKIEDLRAKVHSLKTQKMELHGRIMEMQYRMASLKDEKRTLEKAFDEKQDEIKMLKEREADSIKESPELISLKEILKQRKAEIEDLKQRLQSPPVNIWSVSADDPSNPRMSSTAKESVEWEDKTKSIEDQEQNDQNGQNPTGEAKLQEFENAEAIGQNGEKSISVEQGNEEHGTEAISESEARKSIEEDGNIKVMANEEQGNTGDGQPEKLDTSQDGEGQKLGMLPKAEVKVQVPGDSMNDGDAGSGVEIKHGKAGKAKEKRWRIHDKIREGENIGNSGNNRAATSRKRKSSKSKRNESHSTDTTSQKIQQKHATSLENGSSGMENHSPDVIMPTSRSNSEDSNITDQDTGSASKQGKEAGEERTWEADENQQEMGSRGGSKQGKEVGKERTWEAGENQQEMGSRGGSKQGKEVGEERTWEAGEKQQEMDTRDIHEITKENAEQDKETNHEIADIHRQGTKAANVGTFEHHFENSEEGDKDETDELEF